MIMTIHKVRFSLNPSTADYGRKRLGLLLS